MTRFMLLVLCVLTFSAADTFAARWGHSRDRHSLAAVLLVGPFAYLLFGRLAAVTSLVQMGTYVNGGIVLGTAAAGFLLLGERPDRTTVLGLGLVIAGMVLLRVGKVSSGEG